MLRKKNKLENWFNNIPGKMLNAIRILVVAMVPVVAGTLGQQVVLGADPLDPSEVRYKYVALLQEAL